MLSSIHLTTPRSYPKLFSMLAWAYTLLAASCFFSNPLTAQQHEPTPKPQKDLLDIIKKKRTDNKLLDSSLLHRHSTLLPALGYTQQTGFAVVVNFNMVFKQHQQGESSSKTNLINSSIAYSQYNQIIFPLYVDLWTKNGQYNILSDFRFINYPSSIYGLGGKTDPNVGHTINFSGLKLHQSLLRKISTNLYVGLGLYIDKFWKIKAIDPNTKIISQAIQRQLGTEETAIGPAFKLLLDSRNNPVNADRGTYINFVLHPSYKRWGSSSDFQSLLLDIRTYLKPSDHSKNVLAFWVMNWLTPVTPAPYLLLPSTGWDDSYNSGRGYVQGRFRGSNMVYSESEYRFGISKNGLIGGVAFANFQTFSNDVSRVYSQFYVGYGLGLRLKLNKHSNTNICIDYGLGQNGSNGVFVNVGEVF